MSREYYVSLCLLIIRCLMHSLQFLNMRFILIYIIGTQIVHLTDDHSWNHPDQIRPIKSLATVSGRMYARIHPISQLYVPFKSCCCGRGVAVVISLLQHRSTHTSSIRTQQPPRHVDMALARRHVQGRMAVRVTRVPIA